MILLFRFFICLLSYFVFLFIHDFIFRKIYCYFKKKRNNCGPCYFFNCKHIYYCPYNNPKYFKVKTTIKELFKKD